MAIPGDLERCLRELRRSQTDEAWSERFAAREAAANGRPDTPGTLRRRAARAWDWVLTSFVPDMCARLDLTFMDGGNPRHVADVFSAIRNTDDIRDAVNALREGLVGIAMPPPMGHGVDKRDNERRAVVYSAMANERSHTSAFGITTRASGLHGMMRVVYYSEYEKRLDAQPHLRGLTRECEALIVKLVKAVLWASWTPAADSYVDVAIDGTEQERVQRQTELRDSMLIDVSALMDGALSVLDGMIGEP